MLVQTKIICCLQTKRLTLLSTYSHFSVVFLIQLPANTASNSPHVSNAFLANMLYLKHFFSCMQLSTASHIANESECLLWSSWKRENILHSYEALHECVSSSICIHLNWSSFSTIQQHNASFAVETSKREVSLSFRSREQAIWVLLWRSFIV